MLLFFLAAAACSTSPPADEPAAVEVVEVVEAVEATPLPPGVPAQAPRVAIIGHGLRLELNPPFQAMKVGQPVDGSAPTLVVAWWDVNADGAGGNGRTGLYNVTLVSGQPGTEEPVQAVVVEEGGEKMHVLRRGEGGPALQFPRGVSGLGGMGTLTEGPDTTQWAVQIGDGEAEPFPEGRELLHSWDPATGQAYRFQLQPVQPWGPWKP
jgi:hypothetical protein